MWIAITEMCISFSNRDLWQAVNLDVNIIHSWTFFRGQRMSESGTHHRCGKLYFSTDNKGQSRLHSHVQLMCPFPEQRDIHIDFRLSSILYLGFFENKRGSSVRAYPNHASKG